MPKDLFFSGKITRDRQLLVLVQQLNDTSTAVSEMFVFPSWLKDGCFTPVIPSTFMKEGGRGEGQFPIFVPFIKKFKAFSATTYIFPSIFICPELCAWSLPAAREVEKVIPAMESGMEESLGNYCWVSQLIVSSLDVTNSMGETLNSDNYGKKKN